VVVFSESVTVTTAGWSAKKNGVNWPISSVAGSGNTWTFTMGSAAVNGDTLLISYNAGTGNTLDGAGNELASVTDSSVTNSVAPTGPTLADLTFAAANVNLTVASGVWDGTVNATDWANKGLDAKKIAAGTDGFVQVQFVSGATGCVIGFNTTNANDDYTAYEFAMYLTPATTYAVFGGALGSYAGPTVGLFYRIARIGSAIKLQSSPTGGAGGTWTDIHAFGSPSSADLFICMSIDEKNGDGKCYYPKVYNGV